MINWKKLIISVAISLGIGLLSSLLTMNNQSIYDIINVPKFAPPGWLFPIVWTILYILMGISSYLISEENSSTTVSALTVYFIQLFVNFFWSIIFFSMKNFVFAFIWLLLLIILIVVMIYRFYKIRPVAAYLNIPYLLWVIFAGVLNFSIILLN